MVDNCAPFFVFITLQKNFHNGLAMQVVIIPWEMNYQCPIYDSRYFLILRSIILSSGSLRQSQIITIRIDLSRIS